MKKGFTLIELLAVIAILAIIMLIATPKIMDAINASKYSTLKTNQDMVIKATELYISNNVDLLPENIGDTIEVSLSQIESEDYLPTIISPFNNNSCGGYVLITKIANENYIYNPQLNCIDNTKINKITDGLVGYWKFDNQSGLIDLSGNGNAGNSKGGITIGSAYDQKGKIGGATFFDGIDDYIEVAHAESLNLADSITISAWYLLNDLNSGSGFPRVISKGVNSGWGYQIFAVNVDKIMGFELQGVDVSYRLHKEIDISSWEHIVLTYDGLSLKGYINGELDHAVEVVGSITQNTDPLLIGNRGDLARIWKGIISEVKIYNRALSSEEVKVLYESTK